MGLGIGKFSENKNVGRKPGIKLKEETYFNSLDDDRNRNEIIKMEESGIGDQNDPKKAYKYNMSPVKSAGGFKSGDVVTKP